MTVKNEILGKEYPNKQKGYEFVITTRDLSGYGPDSYPRGCEYQEGQFRPAIIIWGPDFVGEESSLGGTQVAFCALADGEVTIVGGKCQNTACSDHESN